MQLFMLMSLTIGVAYWRAPSFQLRVRRAAASFVQQQQQEQQDLEYEEIETSISQEIPQFEKDGDFAPGAIKKREFLRTSADRKTTMKISTTKRPFTVSDMFDPERRKTRRYAPGVLPKLRLRQLRALYSTSLIQTTTTTTIELQTESSSLRRSNNNKN